MKDYQKSGYLTYVTKVCREMITRDIKFQEKYYNEILDFCTKNGGNAFFNYPEHNDRYLIQCYYNLQEKYDRRIISKEEWEKIEEMIKND